MRVQHQLFKLRLIENFYRHTLFNEFFRPSALLAFFMTGKFSCILPALHKQRCCLCDR